MNGSSSSRDSSGSISSNNVSSNENAVNLHLRKSTLIELAKEWKSVDNQPLWLTNIIENSQNENEYENIVCEKATQFFIRKLRLCRGSILTGGLCLVCKRTLAINTTEGAIIFLPPLLIIPSIVPGNIKVCLSP